MTSRQRCGETGGGRRPRSRGAGWIIGWVALSGVLLPGRAAAQVDSAQIAYPRNLVDPDMLAAPKNPRQVPFSRMPGLSPDYELGPGDEIELTVVGAPQPDFRFRVDSAGEIAIPLVGRLLVAGLTAEEVEGAVADAYRDRGLIKHPEVLVFISSYESKTMYILGEVDRPGEYGVSFQTTLTDLIFMAGGLDFSAAEVGFLHRRVEGAAPSWRPTYTNVALETLASAPDQARPGTEVIPVDLRPMKSGGLLEQDIVLRNGDVFYVPRRAVRVVYVIGEVNRPGAFEIPPQAELRASQAISWGGGPTRIAKMSAGVLVRHHPDGGRTELPVDFAAVLRGDATDFAVQANDVIYIPTSDGKTVGYGVLNVVPRILLFGFLF